MGFWSLAEYPHISYLKGTWASQFPMPYLLLPQNCDNRLIRCDRSNGKCSLEAHRLIISSPPGGTIWGASGNFRKQKLAGGSWSLGQGHGGRAFPLLPCFQSLSKVLWPASLCHMLTSAVMSCARAWAQRPGLNPLKSSAIVCLYLP